MNLKKEDKEEIWRCDDCPAERWSILTESSIAKDKITMKC